MNARLEAYAQSIREGQTPNVPAAFRSEVFDVLTTNELDAYLARLRREPI